jgi:hypothetical protein
LDDHPKIKSAKRRGRFTLIRNSISGVNVFLGAILLMALLVAGEQTQASEYLPAVVETDHNESVSITGENIHNFDPLHSDMTLWVSLTTSPIDTQPGAADNDIPAGPHYTISGTVTDAQDEPIQGGSLSDGTGQTVLTDSNGDYQFTDLPTGIYTITPTYGQYVFSPSFRQVSVPPKANKQDFVQVMPSVYLPIVTRKACQPYFDDFSDPNSGWPNFENERKQYDYIDSEYEILVKNADSWAGASPDFLAAEYQVGVEVHSTSGVIGSHGIIFGLTEDWSGFYTFEIDPEGYYTIWKYSENGGWKNLFVKYSPVINKSTELNQIMVKRVGTLIEVYANGNLLTSITDKTYTGLGYVGLIVSSFEEIKVEARFDNFYVNPITCGTSSQTSAVQTFASLNARPAQFMYLENETKFR